MPHVKDMAMQDDGDLGDILQRILMGAMQGGAAASDPSSSLGQFSRGFTAVSQDAQQRREYQDKLHRDAEHEDYERQQDTLRNERYDRRDAEAKTEVQRKKQVASNERLLNSFLAQLNGGGMGRGSRRTFSQDASLKRWEKTNRLVGDMETAEKLLEYAESVGDQFMLPEEREELRQGISADPSRAEDAIQRVQAARDTYEDRKREEDQLNRQLKQLQERGEEAIQGGPYTQGKLDLLLADVQSGVRTSADALNELQAAADPGALKVRIPGISNPPTEIPSFAVSEQGGSIEGNDNAIAFWVMVATQIAFDNRTHPDDPSYTTLTPEQLAKEEMTYKLRLAREAEKLARLYGGWE